MAQDLSKFQYEVIHDNENVNEKVIKKSGSFEVEFTISEIQQGRSEISKSKKESEGKLEVEKAVMANVAHFHPEVLEFTEEQLHTIAMYQKAKKNVEAAEKNIATCVERLDELMKEEEYILGVLGFRKSEDIIAPQQ